MVTRTRPSVRYITYIACACLWLHTILLLWHKADFLARSQNCKKGTDRFVRFVCLHVTTPFPLGELSLNFKTDDISKNGRENWVLVKIWVLYFKANVDL
jgi:hypothetical protein